MKKFKVELKGELLFLDIEAKDAIEKAFVIIAKALPDNICDDWHESIKEVIRKKVVRRTNQGEITSTVVDSIMNLESNGFVVEERAKELLFRNYCEPDDIFKMAQAKQDKIITVNDIFSARKKQHTLIAKTYKLINMKLAYIENFLTSHGWVLGEEGRVFVSYFPPTRLDLPDDYYIDVPKSEGKGFEKYMNQLIDILEDIYDRRYTRADFEIFFSKEQDRQLRLNI